jgi:hypothetical protein
MKAMDGRSSASTLKQSIETYYTTYGRYPFYEFGKSSSQLDPATPNLAKTKNEQSAGASRFILPCPSHKTTYKGPSAYFPLYSEDYTKNSKYAPSQTMTETEYYDTLIQILAGAGDETILKKYNPKRISFLSGINTEGTYVDPWGNRLGVGFDLTLTPKINPCPVNIPGSSFDYRKGKNVASNVIVWSFGANKINEHGLSATTDGTNPDTGELFDDLPTWKE